MSPSGFEPTPGTPQQVNQRFRPFGDVGLTMICALMSCRIMGYKLIKPLCHNTCQIDYGYMCIGNDCETKFKFIIQMLILASATTAYRTLHWLSKHNQFITCIVKCPFVLMNQDTVRLYNSAWYPISVAERSRAPICLSSQSAGRGFESHQHIYSFWIFRSLSGPNSSAEAIQMKSSMTMQL